MIRYKQSDNARLLVPVAASLLNYDPTAEPTLETETGTDWVGNSISAGGLAVNPMDGRHRQLLTVTTDTGLVQWRLDLTMLRHETLDALVLARINFLDVYPAALRSLVLPYHHTDGTFDAGCTQITPGRVSSGIMGRPQPRIYYNGVDARHEVSDTAALDITGDLTFGVWAKADSSGISGSHLIGKFLQTGNQRSYSMYLGAQPGESNTDYFACYISEDGGSSNRGIEYTDSPVDDVTKWHHYMAVYDASAGTITLYVDGSAVASSTFGTIPNSIHSGSGDLNIGSQDDPGAYFNGSISEPQLYNRALAPKEIEHLYLYPNGGPKALLIGADHTLDFDTGNFTNNGFGTFDVNSTVAGKIYALADGGTDTFLYSGLLTVGHRYSLSIDARLNAGDSVTVKAGGAIADTGAFVSFVPTGTEQTFTGTFTATGTNFIIGNTSGALGTSALEFDNIWLLDLDTNEVWPVALDQWGTLVYAADWSAGVDSWGASGGISLTGNEDGIADDGATSYDDCLNASSNGAPTQRITRGSFVTSTSKYAGVELRYLIDSGNSDVDGFIVVCNGVTVYDARSTGSTPAVVGTWTLLRIPYFIPGSTTIEIHLYDGATEENSDSNDEFYLSLFRSSQIGCVGAWLRDGISKENDQLNDASTNKLHAAGAGGTEYLDAPEAGVPGYLIYDNLTDFKKRYLFVDINALGETADGDATIGLMMWCKTIDLEPDGTLGMRGTLGHTGTLIQQSPVGVTIAEQRHGQRPTYTINPTVLSIDNSETLQELLYLIGGAALPMWLTMDPTNNYPVWHQVRLAADPSWELKTDNEPFTIPVQLVEDL